MFFLNHGLLKIFNRPKWRTVLGGSKNYVEKILKSKNISSYKNSSVKFLYRKQNKIFLNVMGKKKQYDHLIIAVHVQDFPARYSPQMGPEGANVIFDTWVHPLVMGLEEHLLTMFRD